MWSPSSQRSSVDPLHEPELRRQRQLRANRQPVTRNVGSAPTEQESKEARKRARANAGLQSVSVAAHRVRAPAVVQRGGTASKTQTSGEQVDKMTLRWSRMMHSAGRHIELQKNSRLGYTPFSHPYLEQLIRDTVFSYTDFVDTSDHSNVNNIILFKMSSGVGATCLRESVLATRPPLLTTLMRFYELARVLTLSVSELQTCLFPLLFHYFKDKQTDMVVSSLPERMKKEIDELPDSAVSTDDLEEERSNIDDDIKSEKARDRPNLDILNSLEMQKSLRDKNRGPPPYRGYFRYKPLGSSKAIRNPGTKLYPSTPVEAIGNLLPLATQLMSALSLQQYIFNDESVMEELPPIDPDDMARMVGWLEMCVLNDRHSENDTLIREFEMLTYMRYLPPGCQTTTSENYQVLYSDYNGTVAYDKAPHDLVKVCGVIVNDKLPIDEQFLPDNIKHADGVTPYRPIAKSQATCVDTAANPFVPRFIPNEGMVNSMGSLSLTANTTASHVEAERRAAAAARLSVRPVQPSPVQFLTAAQQQSLVDKPRVYQTLPGSTSGRPKYFDELFLAKFDEFMRQVVQIYPMRDFFISHSMLVVSHKRLAQRYTTGMNERRRPLFGYAGNGIWFVSDHIYDGDRYVGHKLYKRKDAPSMIYTWLSFIKYRYKSEIDCTRPIHRFIHRFVPSESEAELDQEIKKGDGFWKCSARYRMSKREIEIEDRERGVYEPSSRPWEVNLTEEEGDLLRAIPSDETTDMQA
jgi:hypothetical protein